MTRDCQAQKNDQLVTHHNRKAREKWIVKPTSKNVGHFTIRSVEHGKYLGSSGDGKLIVSPQRWTIGSSPHGGIFIQSVAQGGWLSCNDNGHPYISEVNEIWETWRLEPIMPGTINGRQLSRWFGIGVATVTLAVAAPFVVVGAVGAVAFGGEALQQDQSLLGWCQLK